ncbi:MAG TPA: tRNA preQ1(34) S-adenosylmethionine ribosyltransferase-isomerase QueA, partial [Longimicrobiaceae bacterium]|nr:tRNA preQ1(34) S-adenosylmethionine ribosyltransferase-isomerase QueA [Longimicrobiaceae bacterium]
MSIQPFSMASDRKVKATYSTADFDFDLPDDRVAQYPAERRGESRLLVVDRASGELTHRAFADLVDMIPPGDVLVLNETRVFPARLTGRKPTGGAAEVLLLHPLAEDPGLWSALVRPGGKLRAGHRVQISDELVVEIVDVLPGGERAVRLITDLPTEVALDRYGSVPLPPYVRRAPTAADRERYQTVYARERGSVAAPTAGLHFTPDHLARIERRGVRIARVVLHVGVGTFRPVEVDDPDLHDMHSEWYHISPEAADILNDTRAAGGAVWAVGTTCVRTIEAAAAADGTVEAGERWTNIFIRPTYEFKAVDHLITNFHLPRSTLLMLVAAFAGYDLTMLAYKEAVAEGYRFYSYGDAMV